MVQVVSSILFSNHIDMKKNFLFGTLAVLLAGFWFGGASLAADITCEDDTAVACINSLTWYTKLQDAINAASETDTDTVTLLTGITLESNVIIDKNIILDLNQKTITGDVYRFIFSWNIEATLTGNWTIITNNASLMNIWKDTNDHWPNVTIENGTFVALTQNAIQVFWKLTIKDATIKAKNTAVLF